MTISNTFDKIGSKLINLYDDGQSSGLFGVSIRRMKVEYIIHSIRK